MGAAPEGLNDRPESVFPSSASDEPTRRDDLGFEPYVKALASFLTHRQTQGPLAVSIEGDWGSGKSSFMLQLEEELSRRFVQAADGHETRPLTVRFNAWRHEKEEALWAAFALHFIEEVSAEQPFLVRKWRRLNLSVRRFSWREGWLDAAKALLFLLLFITGIVVVGVLIYVSGWRSIRQLVESFLLAPPTPAEAARAGAFPELLLKVSLAVGGSVGYLILIALFWSILGKYFKNPLDLDLSKHLESPSYKHRVSFVENFHEDFSKIVRALVGERRVFVFIDDLDRCEVPKTADLMQALNLMISENPQLIFVLGMDREKVAAGIAVKHEKSLPYLLSLQASFVEHTEASRVRRGLEFGYEFIEKFIQIPFLVPKPTAAELARLLKGLAVPIAPSPFHIASTEGIRLWLYRWWYGRGRVTAAAPQGFTMRMESQNAVEGRRDRIRFLATEDSPKIQQIVLSVAPALDYNPRRLKQFINLFRLKAFIAAETGLFDLPEGFAEDDGLTLEQLGKFTAILLKWPLLIPEFEKDHELLSNLERQATGGDYSFERTRWLDQNLTRLLCQGCLDSKRKPTEDAAIWSLAKLKVDKLLQVSPRVRTIPTEREKPIEPPSPHDERDVAGSQDRRPTSGVEEHGDRRSAGEGSVTDAPLPYDTDPFDAQGGRQETSDEPRRSVEEDRMGVDDSAEYQAANAAPSTARQAFEVMPARFNKEAARGLKAVYEFNLTGDGGGKWQVIIKDQKVEVKEGANATARADITISMAAQDYLDMLSGKLNGQEAFMKNKLRIEGDMGLALRMQSLFST